MKKMLLVMSLISVLFLAGCSWKNNVNSGNVINNSDGQMQGSGEELTNADNSGEPIENSSDQTQGSGNELIEDLKSDPDQEKYKLSDSYYVSGESIYEKDYLFKFAPPEIDNEADRKEIYEYKRTVESDGTNIDLNIVYERSNTYPYTDLCYDVRINGKNIEFGGPTSGGGDYMWLIDLDEADQYKEIAILRVWGLESQIKIYRLTKYEIRLLFDVYNDWNTLLKVKNKWIFTEYYDSDIEILMGYYLYEDGGFKYIDRLATGEKITDENGVFPKGFQEIEFGVGGETSFGEYKGINFYGVFNILSRNADGSYNIRLTKPCYSDPEEQKEIFPAGTVLEDVRLLYSW